MDYTSIQDIIKHGLHQYIDGFQKQLNLVSEAIREDFFTSEQTQSQAQTQTQTQTSSAGNQSQSS